MLKLSTSRFFFGTGSFQNSSHKLSRIKFVFTVSVLKFMFRGVKGTKYVLFLEYLKFIANCSRAKRKHEKKRNISTGLPWNRGVTVDLRTGRCLPRKIFFTLFWKKIDKNIPVQKKLSQRYA